MSAKPIKEIIKNLFSGPDYKEINNTINIEEAWTAVVGKLINSKTKVITYKNNTITIKVSDPVWRNEISMQKENIVSKLNKIEPDLKIMKIILK